MKRSTERILTTHTGSLARPPELLQMLVAREEGKPVAPEVFDATVRGAVLEKVKRQIEIGLAVVNDGEQSKISFATYVRERLHGFGGADEARPVGLEARQFPAWAARRATPYRRPACNAPVAWKDFAAVEKDIANLKAATAGLPVEEVFMTAVSPGTLANFFPNRLLPEPRSVPGSHGRGDEAGVRRHRPGRFPPAARLPRPGPAQHLVSRSLHPGVPHGGGAKHRGA